MLHLFQNHQSAKIISHHYLWQHGMHSLGKHPYENSFLLFLQHLSHLVVLTATLTAKVSSPQHCILPAVIDIPSDIQVLKLFLQICDLGSARTFEHTAHQTTIVGTYAWMAPEVGWMQSATCVAPCLCMVNRSHVIIICT